MQQEEEPAPIPLVNVEAEAALLGALMIDNRLLERVQSIVDEKVFYEPLHARLFRAIAKFVTGGKIANPVTLKPIFDFDPAMKALGGPAYLAQLTGSGAAVIGAESFAEQLRELYNLRTVRDAIETATAGLNENASYEDLLADVEIAVARASMSMRQVETFSTAQMFDMVRNRVDTSLEKGVPGAACKLIVENDTLLGKLEPGQMTIVAARPGMGKSTWAVSSSLGYALNGHAGLYALCESSNEMFSLKMASDLLHAAGKPIRFKTIKQGILNREERADLDRAAEVAKLLPVSWVHIGREDVKRLEAVASREAMRLKRQGKKLEFIVVDYLQLLTANGRHRVGDDRGRVNAISEALLSLAQKLETHVIALSQLSRDVEKRGVKPADKKPRLSDLRESGRLEEDADNVMLLFREEYYLEQSKPQQEGAEMEAWLIDMGHARDKVELIAAKTRFGANASRKVQFLGDYSAIRSAHFQANTLFDDDNGDLFERFGA